ncbi:MAG TPA: xanthine dehydrogenase family protein subunit M [Candidatus Acidoferrales bacterium]|nr:xanthine dehydrogenase family protein subunit M [Candidatus Acidoferrales bacterium]
MTPFEYLEPRSLKEVCANLKQYGSEGKLVAGGTALIIMMKQRLVRPAALISLRSLRGLNQIAIDDGGLRIGSLVTHRELETNLLTRRRFPLLSDTYRQVATIRIRNMATVGGGLAHADPNQDPPPALIALNASVKVTSADGSRVIPIEEFFKDYYETVLRPEEIITEVIVPRQPANSGGAFLKFLPRTADDYATVSAAAMVSLDKTRKVIEDVRIGLGSVGVTPIRAREAEAVLRGQPITPEALREAGEKAKGEVDPISDIRGSAWYKKEMVGVFVRRALEQAISAARGAATRGSARPVSKAVGRALVKAAGKLRAAAKKGAKKTSSTRRGKKK